MTCNLAVIASRSCYSVNLLGCYMFNMLRNDGIRVQTVCMDLTKDPVLCVAINDMWPARSRKTVSSMELVLMSDSIMACSDRSTSQGSNFLI